MEARGSLQSCAESVGSGHDMLPLEVIEKSTMASPRSSPRSAPLCRNSNCSATATTFSAGLPLVGICRF
ncbi:hypothetical protein D0Y65_024380 [Glycine soja]|uniref:Uncharacterized protein n=1 Tax=Glycine soja TaxID=3848 RepID=A0A445J1X6_GLYSO|nr:hypothetical protein D0Y65_024380 [Glycine soja]